MLDNYSYTVKGNRIIFAQDKKSGRFVKLAIVQKLYDIKRKQNVCNAIIAAIAVAIAVITSPAITGITSLLSLFAAIELLLLTVTAKFI